MAKVPGGDNNGGIDPIGMETNEMIAIFVHEGDAIDHTPAADVAAGDVVVQGELVGVAKLDIKAGVRGSLSVAGVFDFPKEVGGEKIFGAGVEVYWDEANQLADTDAATGANKRIGRSIVAAGSEDPTVRVRMSQ